MKSLGCRSQIGYNDIFYPHHVWAFGTITSQQNSITHPRALFIIIIIIILSFFTFIYNFFFFYKARRYGIRAVTSIICVWGWGGGFRGLSQIYSRSWLHIMMRLLSQRCRKKLQLPSATSFFISKYGSVFDNCASDPLSGSTLAYNRSFHGPPLPSNQSLCEHANKANRLSSRK